MNLEELREYCLHKSGAEESLPFGEDTLVFKIGGKMFLLTSINSGNSFNVKCDPERAIELRETFTEVKPGFHMNKKMWNTVAMDGTLSNCQLEEMIDHSYHLIIKSLPKKLQGEITGNQ